MGRLDEALQFISASLAQDPLHPSSYLVLYAVQIRRSRPAEAGAAALRRALEISPTFTFAHYGIGLLQLIRNDAQAALAEMLQRRKARGTVFWRGSRSSILQAHTKQSPMPRSRSCSRVR